MKEGFIEFEPLRIGLNKNITARRVGDLLKLPVIYPDAIH
jgi:hypothetical protein